MDPKPYIVIARKYRPQTFDEVIGQDAVATTLKNAIQLNRIGHAYLFTGPRGVGKTSMARIFAKALNCKNGPTLEPCGKCQACLEIETARALDVLEIDGASNRGIDEIRALRENVKFAPAMGKFKIYIIDEVHQITTDGFNALLKTLEEPPAHVKFIFATTSAHKVPATILSRCQRFDFRRIPTDVIASTLKEICKKEKIKADEEALFAIAKAADGSLRDSQSILDQIAAQGQDKISKEDVVRSLGALEEEKLFEIMEALADHDAAKALLLLDGVLQEGKDAALFLERVLEHVRNLLFVSVSEKLVELIEGPESYKKDLLKQKSRFTQEDLFYAATVITHTLQTMKRFEAKRIPLEMALIKLSHKTPTESISEVLKKIQNLEKKTPAPELRQAPRPISNATIAPTKKEEKIKVEKVEEEVEIPEIEELPQGDIPLEDVKEKKFISLDHIWQPLIRILRTEKISVASYLSEGEPQGLHNGVAKISFPERLSFHRETLEKVDNRTLIEKHISSLLERVVRVEFESVKELSGKTFAAQEGETVRPKADPASDNSIKSAMNIFGGKIIS